MSFIETYFRKQPHEITEDDLNRFVGMNIEECLNLEYKHGDKLIGGYDDLAKSVSSFANAEGGLLVVGVSERKSGGKILPGEVTWCTDSAHTKEWVEQVIIGRVRPRMRGVRIVPVHSDKGYVYLIDVPPSDNPPHMAPDCKYYQRANFLTYPMEHYQVADAFGKRHVPILKPILEISEFRNDSGNATIRFGVENTGRTSARWPEVLLNLYSLRAVGRTEGEGLIFSEEVVDGRTIHTIACSFESKVIHPRFRATIEEINIRLAESLSVVQIVVGTLQAPTHEFLTIIGEEWLRDRTGKYGKGTWLELPAFGLDDLESTKYLETWLSENFHSDMTSCSSDKNSRVIVDTASGIKIDLMKIAERIKHGHVGETAPN